MTAHVRWPCQKQRSICFWLPFSLFLSFGQAKERKDPLIKPNRISLSSQIQGKFFLHQKGLLPRHWFQIDMIIETGT
jgi:hypothetical protein